MRRLLLHDEKARSACRNLKHDIATCKEQNFRPPIRIFHAGETFLRMHACSDTILLWAPRVPLVHVIVKQGDEER